MLMLIFWRVCWMEELASSISPTMCWQKSAAALSLYVSVIHSLADVVGIGLLLADSALNNLLQRIVRPVVGMLLIVVQKVICV